jgi:hypothetical protein
MASKGKGGSSGRKKSHGPVRSKAQQKFLFATHKTFAKRWSHEAGETGPRGNPASKAAYARLPKRKGLPKRP